MGMLYLASLQGSLPFQGIPRWFDFTSMASLGRRLPRLSVASIFEDVHNPGD